MGASDLVSPHRIKATSSQRTLRDQPGIHPIYHLKVPLSSTISTEEGYSPISQTETQLRVVQAKLRGTQPKDSQPEPMMALPQGATLSPLWDQDGAPENTLGGRLVLTRLQSYEIRNVYRLGN